MTAMPSGGAFLMSAVSLPFESVMILCGLRRAYLELYCSMALMCSDALMSLRFAEVNASTYQSIPVVSHLRRKYCTLPTGRAHHPGFLHRQWLPSALLKPPCHALKQSADESW